MTALWSCTVLVPEAQLSGDTVTPPVSPPWTLQLVAVVSCFLTFRLRDQQSSHASCLVPVMGLLHRDRSPFGRQLSHVASYDILMLEMDSGHVGVHCLVTCIVSLQLSSSTCKQCSISYFVCVCRNFCCFCRNRRGGRYGRGRAGALGRGRYGTARGAHRGPAVARPRDDVAGPSLHMHGHDGRPMDEWGGGGGAVGGAHGPLLIGVDSALFIREDSLGCTGMLS